MQKNSAPICGARCPTGAKHIPKRATNHQTRTVALKNNTPITKIYSTSMEENTSQLDWWFFIRRAYILNKSVRFLQTRVENSAPVWEVTCHTEAKHLPKLATQHQTRTVAPNNNTPMTKIYSNNMGGKRCPSGLMVFAKGAQARSFCKHAENSAPI